MRTLLASQHNCWIHALATGLVLAAFLCDVASPAFHPLVARAKDVAAGAVLICAIGALVVAALIFAPHLLGSP